MFSGELSALAVTGGILLAATIAVRRGKRQRDEEDDDHEDEQHNNYLELAKKVSEAIKSSCRWDSSSHRLVLSFNKDQVPQTKKQVLDTLNAAGLKVLTLDDTSVTEGDKTTTSSVISIAPPNSTQSEKDYLEKLTECFTAAKKVESAKVESETSVTSSAAPASKRARGSKN